MMSTTRALLSLCLCPLLAASLSACSGEYAGGNASDTAESAATAEAGAETGAEAGAVDAGDGASTDHDGAAGDAAVSELFVDPRDGKSYRTMAIGGHAWFARNLDHEIPGASFCYDDSPQRCVEHGRLYPWSVARTACPPGAHLGSDDEWKDLEAALGMAADQLDLEGYATTRGASEGANLKAPAGFAATMAGFRGGAAYEALGDRTYFWTSSTRGSEVWRRRIAAATPSVFRFTNPPASFAISVRCVVD